MNVRGMNVVVLSGNVGSVKFAKTKRYNEDTCSFMLASEKKNGEVTWVRVNVYGQLAVDCQNFMRTGIAVEVVGELMERTNSSGDNKIIEVRGKEINFLRVRNREDHDDGYRYDDGNQGNEESTAQRV